VSDLNSIDHNQYIKGEWSFQSNYTAGLRILSLKDVANANLEEVAYFDTYPANNGANFNGTWSNYPFFDSQNVIVSDIGNGLFVLRPVITQIELISNSCPTLDIEYSLEVESGLNGTINISVNDLPDGLTFSLSNNTPSVGDEIILSIQNTASVAAGEYPIEVMFSDGLINHREEIILNVPEHLTAPQNLNSELTDSTIELSWDAVTNSIACKIRGRIIGNANFIATPILFGFELDSHTVPLSILQNGAEYEWQVVCGCSVNPIVASPWSGFNVFAVPLGVADENLKNLGNTFEIYPNPTKEFLNIYFEDNLNDGRIEIFNSQSQLLLDYNLLSKKTLKFNIEHLTKGIYFARLSDGDQKISIQKFIVH